MCKLKYQLTVKIPKKVRLNMFTSFFETINLQDNDKYSAFYCLKKFNPLITKKIYNDNKLNYIENMINYVKENNYNVKIIGNFIKLKNDTELDNFIELKFKNRFKLLHKININDIHIPIYYNNENHNYIIIYDIFSKKYMLSDELKFKYDIYYSKTHNIYIKKEYDIEETENYIKKRDNILKYFSK
jgi:hypothetical protein